jgi:hypothetical protein
MLVFYDEDLLTSRCISGWRTTSCLLYATAYSNLEAVSPSYANLRIRHVVARKVMKREGEEKENGNEEQI